MNAAQLLATVTARGATARAEIGDDGAAVLVVAPRSVIGDLLPDLARFKPALLELLASDAPTPGSAAAPTSSAQPDDDEQRDERARQLLAKYRRGGALLELETIERDGAAWLALACDLTDVPQEKRGRAFEQMERNAPKLRRALELETNPK